ncbi:MAG: hypothetical protein Q8N18_02560 [Opitutaceae bacterium]|nr:hypothetical protein [Opitutaceae bacterium]
MSYRSIFFFWLACVCSASEPVFVVLERNPWASVIGSDSPTFALYDDGTVIWRPDKPTGGRSFLHGRTRDVAAALREIEPRNLGSFEKFYELTSWTDQPTTVIWTPKKTVMIYGQWRHVSDPSRETDPQLREILTRDRAMNNALPAELRTSLIRIDAQRKHEGDIWLPERVQVMLWPFPHTREEPIPWPKKWPGLSAKDTVKRGGDSYSVYLPATELSTLRDLLAKREQRRAILIDEQKMSAAVRLPFPREELWMKN